MKQYEIDELERKIATANRIILHIQEKYEHIQEKYEYHRDEHEKLKALLAPDDEPKKEPEKVEFKVDDWVYVKGSEGWLMGNIDRCSYDGSFIRAVNYNGNLLFSGGQNSGCMRHATDAEKYRVGAVVNHTWESDGVTNIVQGTVKAFYHGVIEFDVADHRQHLFSDGGFTLIRPAQWSEK